MRRTRFFTALLGCVILTPFLRADCTKDQDHRSNKRGGVLITNFTINGTQSLDSDELAAITAELTGSCFDEDSEELGERVRALFQNHGYFGVEVKNLHIKPSDPIAVPKPATLEAEVLEGARYRLAEIKFTGNNAFTADELRRKFALKKGALFSREKAASGLDSLHEVYVSNGFIDFASIPNTQFSSDAMVNLSIGVMEGRQYHMGKLEIFTKKEIAEKLRAEWELPEGAVFDPTYLDKYIDRNRSLLPSGFQRSHVQIVRDCPKATVEVRLPLDAMDPRSQSLPKNSRCDSPDNSSK
jgi:outer membrane protein assembly factor BamA